MIVRVLLTAAAIAGVEYRDEAMRTRRIFTAWDSREHERPLFRGLEALVRAGVAPAHIMVYMLVGYWPGETHADRDHRRRRIREFGAIPYPMPYQRTDELRGFQRWVMKGLDLSTTWEAFAAARYEPRRLPGGRRRVSLPLFPEER